MSLWYALVHLHVVGCVLLSLALIATAMVSTWQRRVRYGESSKWLETTGGITTSQNITMQPAHKIFDTKFENVDSHFQQPSQAFFLWWSRTKKKHEWQHDIVMRYRQLRYWEEPCRIFSTNPRNDVLANLLRLAGRKSPQRGAFGTQWVYPAGRACCLKVPRDELLRKWKNNKSAHVQA